MGVPHAEPCAHRAKGRTGAYAGPRGVRAPSWFASFNLNYDYAHSFVPCAREYTRAQLNSQTTPYAALGRAFETHAARYARRLLSGIYP